MHEGKLASSQIKKGNILIVMAGVNVGRCATYTQSEECNANQAVAILTVNENEIIPEYLTQYLNSKIGQLFFKKLQHISSQPNINLEEIQRIKVVLPNKDQQQEIIMGTQNF
jgi:restriction endonuclease S subunit